MYLYLFSKMLDYIPIIIFLIKLAINNCIYCNCHIQFVIKTAIKSIMMNVHQMCKIPCPIYLERLYILA